MKGSPNDERFVTVLYAVAMESRREQGGVRSRLKGLTPPSHHAIKKLKACEGGRGGGEGSALRPQCDRQ